MLTLEIEGLQALQRQLSGLDRQLSQAIATGMNRTMRAVEQHQLNAMERHLDRPTPFTMNAIGVFPANPSRLQTTLFVKDIQASYLRTAIFGGNIDNTIVPVISNVRLNPYGNLPGKRRGLAGVAGQSGARGLAGVRGIAKRRFVGKVGGTMGVWERQPNRRLKAIAVVDKDAPRQKRLPWFETAQRVIQDRAVRDVQGEIDRLLIGR
jgi:hypothetical protein